MFYKKLVLVITFIGIVFIGADVAQAAYIAPPSTVGEAVVLIDADTKEILYLGIAFCGKQIKISYK